MQQKNEALCPPVSYWLSIIDRVGKNFAKRSITLEEGREIWN